MPAALSDPIICYVTDRRALGSHDSIPRLIEKIGIAATAGADWVQIREKDLPARDLLMLTREVVGGAAVRVLVNDRTDVALAAGAAGVHLGGESTPAREAIGWLRHADVPAAFQVGVSCHTLEDAREAESAGASYIFFGPIFDTPSKRPYGQPQGIVRLSEICQSVRIPVVAIGGVDEGNAVECIRAGAAGIAAIRLFQEERPPGALENLVRRIHRLA